MASSRGQADERPRALTIPLEKTPTEVKQKAKIAKTQIPKMPTTPALLDARPAFEYSTSHVAGAINVRVGDFLQNEEGHKGQLDPDLDLLVRKLRVLGVAPARGVIVYGSGSHGDSAEGELAWILKFLGVEKVEVKNIQNETAKKTVAVPENHYSAPPWTPQPHEEIRLRKADLENLLQNKTPISLVDVRSEKEFKGGHIDGAVNIPWTLFFNDAGDLIGTDNVVRLFKEHKLNPDADLVIYGVSGYSSALVTFAALQAHLHAKNYDGGWDNWKSQETGTSPKR